ncbi:hypothetical protein [Leptospira haakeii]|uniref:Glyoxalase n=1 Tax=Leptospira haakeii TaxID=2023198 RepID=A0ABX4PK25_9LEPT|nr:hypothetical protein [Leptospira haakeii]PKA14743.1 hypothetical protein CH363_17015 [Leptospira haakeii]PKA19557.1 hypothetical protein CH377_11325 [Leptospira haakeii]
MEKDSLSFFGTSLKAEDCSKSAKLYSELFGGEVQVSSPGHAEILFSENQRVIFSKETEECPVTPGTLVWKIVKTQVIFFEIKLLSSGFQKESETTKYSSYLDPWQNRLWLYW